jgi:hypothetical protein
VVHPPDNICFRGGGFDNKFRDFFAVGRRYRQPCYLATSFSQATAEAFIGRCSSDVKVLWRVQIDPTHKCVNVNLVTRRVPGLPDEQEYLFAAYSAFTVTRVQWRSGTTASPHIIEVLAAVDNMKEPEDLPLAPWS